MKTRPRLRRVGRLRRRGEGERTVPRMRFERAPSHEASVESLELRRTGVALGLVPLGYGGVAVAEVWLEGHHPLSPHIAVIGVTATSMAVLAWMACQGLVGMQSLVPLAAMPAAVHAWAMTCLDPAHDGALSFPITILASALVLKRPRDVLFVVVAVAWAFFAAAIASYVRRPFMVGATIAAAGVASIGLASLRDRHDRRRMRP